jgi:hypothetical protein
MPYHNPRPFNAIVLGIIAVWVCLAIYAVIRG